MRRDEVGCALRKWTGEDSQSETVGQRQGLSPKTAAVEEGGKSRGRLERPDPLRMVKTHTKTEGPHG